MQLCNWWSIFLFLLRKYDAYEAFIFNKQTALFRFILNFIPIKYNSININYNNILHVLKI